MSVTSFMNGPPWNQHKILFLMAADAYKPKITTMQKVYFLVTTTFGSSQHCIFLKMLLTIRFGEFYRIIIYVLIFCLSTSKPSKSIINYKLTSIYEFRNIFGRGEAQ